MARTVPPANVGHPNDVLALARGARIADRGTLGDLARNQIAYYLMNHN